MGFSASRRVDRVALCTLGAGAHGELLDIAMPRLEEFATRHGYELVAHRRLLAPERPPSWSKVVALYELAASFERVVWVDADAVVVDPSVDLAAQLRPGRNLGLAVHRYDGNEVPNCGVWVLRGGRWARHFLERVWSCTDLIEHRWWENAAVLRLLGYTTTEPVARVARTAVWHRFQELDVAWNAVPVVYVERPRIVHLAGLDQSTRVRELSQLAAGG